jgi:hypothetical protein
LSCSFSGDILETRQRLIRDARHLSLAWALVWKSEETIPRIEATRSKQRFSVREKTLQVAGKDSEPKLVVLHPQKPVTIRGVALRHGIIQRRIECAWPSELCAEGSILHSQCGSIRVTPPNTVREPHILQVRTYQHLRFPVRLLLPHSERSEDITSVCHIHSYRIAAFEDQEEAQRFCTTLLKQRD